MTFGHLAQTFAKELAKGDYLPSRPGALAYGYDLWARHENGDVILQCGRIDGWFDWFRPVQAGDEPDFILVIAGVTYRLVRGVDDIPAGFTVVGTDRPADLRRIGRPRRDAAERVSA